MVDNTGKMFRIYLCNNQLKIYFTLFVFVFVFVLSSTHYHQVNAIDETSPAFENSFGLTGDNDSFVSGFPNSNTTNLTNNKEDSIYGQIEAFGNNVYVVWQESVIKSLPKHNYDIFFIKSEDKGKTFGKPINLSNNTEYSERPQIAVSGKEVFVVWADKTSPDNKEVMFAKSLDNGTTFSKAANISNTSRNSNHPEISVYGDHVYVVWRDTTEDNTNGSIFFKHSPDRGNTFNNPIELTNNTDASFPKVTSYGNYVYVVWNDENKENQGIFFAKSSDVGNSFDEVIKLPNRNSGEAQISASGNKVLVTWGSLHSKNIGNIYLVESNDNGSTFKDSKAIADLTMNKNGGNFSQLAFTDSPLNVEVDMDNNNHHSYISWQNPVSSQNHDIFLGAINQSNENLEIINLSNNAGISECPSIAVYGNNLYAIWEDFAPGNHEILFAKLLVS